jgi:hypothetical protein
MKKHRKYIKSEEIKELVERVFDENGRGTTIEDIINTFEVAKNKAQRIVKHLHDSKVLFTAQDLEIENIHIEGIKRERPQKYYSISSKTKLVERLKKNVLKDTTGYIDPLGDQKADNFSQALAMLGPSLLFIHKLQLWTTIDLEKVDPSETFKSKPLPWSFTDRIGIYDVKYVIHPNGSVMIYVISSSKPFRLYKEQDVIDVLTFLGMVEFRFRSLMSDPRGRIVSAVSRWVLKACDVNKDVKVSRVAQITLPDLQIPFVDKALRAYVKPIEDKVFYRVEWSLVPNKPVKHALETIRKEVNIDKESLIEYLSA